MAEGARHHYSLRWTSGLPIPTEAELKVHRRANNPNNWPVGLDVMRCVKCSSDKMERVPNSLIVCNFCGAIYSVSF